jgi:hypothetical protein
MGIFSSIFKKKPKNNKMEINEQNIEEARSYYSAFEFQWIKGDYQGMTETYKDIQISGEMNFILFESGNRINGDLLNEFMIVVPAQPKIIQPVAPVQPKPSKDVSTVTSIIYEDNDKNTNTDSPIYKLLKKQKKNMVDVSIKIKLNLPPKDLYTVLSGSFEDAEKEIIDFVLDAVDIEDIKASLAQSIKKTYYTETAKPQDQANKKTTRSQKDSNE